VVEDGTAVEICVESAALVVRDDDELPLTGGGELDDVGRGGEVGSRPDLALAQIDVVLFFSRNDL
jgi:hypothetical protein